MFAAIALALLSSFAYGAADFSGGLAARGAHVLRVLVISSPASLLIAVLAWPLVGAHFSAWAISWGAVSGLVSAASFGLLYYTLALGPMSVLSPITAVMSAALPAAIGLLTGDHLTAAAVIGLALALAAVVIISAGPTTHGQRPTTTALVLAVGAGAAIAVQLICFDLAPHNSGVAVLVINRAVTAAVVLAAAGAARDRLGDRRPSTTASSAAGALVALANLAFLLAVHQGQLAIVAVISALYPAGTVLLARAILDERVTSRQIAGLTVGAIAVALLATG